MKYDYGISNGKDTTMFASKYEALTWAQDMVGKAKETLSLVRRVRKVDETLVENLKDFFSKKIPIARPIISPKILEARKKELAEAKAESKAITKKIKPKEVKSIKKKMAAQKKAFVDDTVKVTKINI